MASIDIDARMEEVVNRRHPTIRGQIPESHYTVAESAYIVGISVTTLKAWIRQEDVKPDGPPIQRGRLSVRTFTDRGVRHLYAYRSPASCHQ